VDTEVGNISHWSFQGSTALAIVVHENTDADAADDDENGCECEGGGTMSIVVANVGDSRAVLCRDGRAMDLTRDHKPDDDDERRRIEGYGGTVDWCGDVDDVTGRPIHGAGVYRINGNLALSRSIGDRAERPCVSGTPDVFHHVIREDDDSFALLATDGLFDVMSSAEAVSFVNDLLGRTPPEDRHGIRRDVARHLVEEAIRRGTCDNVTVLVVWFDDDKMEHGGTNPK
jgi:serine/threonine protein phosphatase PrpC